MTPECPHGRIRNPRPACPPRSKRPSIAQRNRDTRACLNGAISQQYACAVRAICTSGRRSSGGRELSELRGGKANCEASGFFQAFGNEYRTPPSSAALAARRRDVNSADQWHRRVAKLCWLTYDRQTLAKCSSCCRCGSSSSNCVLRACEVRYRLRGLRG